MNVEWTDKLLSIPAAVACEYSRGRCRLSWDELRSLAALGMMRGARAFDPSKPHNGENGLAPFLVRAARFSVMSALGRRKLTPRQLDDEAAALLPGRGEAPYGRDDLWAAVAQVLTADEVQLLRLRFIDGLSLPAIGKRLGIGKQAASWRARKCIGRLREAWTNKEEMVR